MTNITDLVNELLSLGLRAEEIASRTGAGIATVYRWKNGSGKARRMSVDRVAALLKYEKKKRESNINAT